jgi:hypothetical protein
MAEAGIRSKRLEAFPFSVLYSIEEEEIVVVAVAHDKRKPGYWMKRT